MTEQKAVSVDPSTLPPRDRYKLLTGLIIPRPIAFVTSVSREGVANAAPFSFFNLVSDTPPVCVLGIDPKSSGGPKDTVTNVIASKEYVVNLVDEALGPKMNLCATDFPAGISEPDAVGLALAPGATVKVPRLVDAPVSLECRLREKVELDLHHYVLLGDILHIHVRPGLVDPASLRTDLSVYRPLARLSGNQYASLGPLIVHERLSYVQWQAKKAAE
jgi:flavin reductase (DIM6/NTAB) family NADH-FMN oxidoreductase RutF